MIGQCALEGIKSLNVRDDDYDDGSEEQDYCDEFSKCAAEMCGECVNEISTLNYCYLISECEEWECTSSF